MNDSGSSVLVGSNGNSYSYALSGKIMLASIIVVFSLVIIIVCFHSYARRSRRRQLHRQRQRHLLFNSDATATTSTTESNTSKGLDSFVLKSLPTFNYSCNTNNPPLECAVCLSEFEEFEMGRLLPKCKHCFHVQCIDMWFQSHSSCPLCRSPVQPIVVSVSVTETVLSIDDHAEATDMNSGMYQSCRMSCSASSPALASLQMEERERKPLQHVGISIDQEVPSMYERLKVLEEEMGSGYSRGHHGLKSPRGSGILSLKRIWSV